MIPNAVKAMKSVISLLFCGLFKLTYILKAHVPEYLRSFYLIEKVNEECAIALRLRLE